MALLENVYSGVQGKNTTSCSETTSITDVPILSLPYTKNMIVVTSEDLTFKRAMTTPDNYLKQYESETRFEHCVLEVPSGVPTSLSVVLEALVEINQAPLCAKPEKFEQVL